jgi:hypothetical protein
MLSDRCGSDLRYQIAIGYLKCRLDPLTNHNPCFTGLEIGELRGKPSRHSPSVCPALSWNRFADTWRTMSEGLWRGSRP